MKTVFAVSVAVGLATCNLGAAPLPNPAQQLIKEQAKQAVREELREETGSAIKKTKNDSSSDKETTGSADVKSTSATAERKKPEKPSAMR